jgi:PBP1b-binding outer membrane lipoprotein LpoB
MKSVITVLCVMLLLSGCATMASAPKRSGDVNAELKALKPYFSADVIATYNGKGDGQKKYRDEVVFARIRAIDLNYTQFINDISREDKGMNIGTDTAVLLLDAAGALSKISSTQAIFAQSSGVLTGVKASIDKNAYYDKTLYALISQMQASRQAALFTLYNGLETGVDQYPLLKALIDVESYYQAGTILGAVTAITKSSGEQKAIADKEIIEIKKGQHVKDNAGTTILHFWMPNGKKINTINEQTIKDWMKKNGLDTKVISIPLFIHNKDYSDLRTKAVNEIPIP